MNKQEALQLFRNQWNLMAEIYQNDPENYVGEYALQDLKHEAIEQMGFQNPHVVGANENGLFQLMAGDKDVVASCFCCHFLDEQERNNNAPNCSMTNDCIVSWTPDGTDGTEGIDPCLVSEFGALDEMLTDQHTPVHDPITGKLVKTHQHEPSEILAYIKKIANLPENPDCIWADKELINGYWIDHYHAE